MTGCSDLVVTKYDWRHLGKNTTGGGGFVAVAQVTMY